MDRKIHRIDKSTCVLILLALSFLSVTSPAQGDSLADALRSLQLKKDTAGIVLAQKKIADSYFSNDSANKGFDELMKALDLANLFKNDSILGFAHYNLGYAHYRYGNILPALHELELASGFFVKAGRRDQVAKTELLLGNIQSSFRNFTEALKFYNSCYKYWFSLKDNRMISVIHNNLGLVYIETGDTTKASYEFFSSLAIRLELGDSSLIGQTYNNIGTLKLKTGRNAEALEYFKKGLAYRRAVTAPESARLESMVNIGKALFKLNRLAESELYIRNALRGAEVEKRLELKRRCVLQLKEILFATGRFAEAYRIQDEYYALTDSMFGIQKREETFRHGVQYEYKKKLLQDSLTNAEEKKRLDLAKQKEEEIAAEKDKRNYILFGALGLGLVLTGAFVFVLAKRNKEKLVTNKIISAQKDELETRQKEIQDSIRYARRIQDALLPSEKEITDTFPGSFIFYKPKDIISGDFYWAETIEGRTWLALGDCTGHGVPGAMMSMLGISFLNEALREKGNIGPARMLDELHRKVVHSLNRDATQREMLDGMDIALLCIDKSRRMITFALASRPLMIISNGEKKLIKGERHAIGGIKDTETEPFRQLMISVKPGDTICLYSDGFADQFGGPDGKKYKSKILEDTLLAACALNDNERLRSLENKFSKWRGNLEQVDDVTVIGIKIN